MLIAIDTSTTQTGLACYDQGGMLAECIWYSGRDHSTQLLPQLTLLLRHLARTIEAIDAVAVALGPGSWSGLRVGVSTAKGLALARDLPLIGIGTLEALAYQHLQPRGVVVPLIQLGRGRFAFARFTTRDLDQRTAQLRNTTLEELCADIGDRTLFCGDIDDAVREELRQRLGNRVQFPSPAANLRRPGYLAELAWQRWRAGQADDIAGLEPIYLGNPVKPVAENKELKG